MQPEFVEDFDFSQHHISQDKVRPAPVE
jgi:hypothetical protein